MLRHVRDILFRRGLQQRELQYAQPMTDTEREAWQLEQLNKQWAVTAHDVPFYREMVSQGDAPKSFTDFEQFMSLIPTTTKTQLRGSMSERLSGHKPPERYLTTGGTTAEPLSIPAWRSERSQLLLNMWIARGWYGIRPSSRLFLFWGHSHLLGSGFRAKVRGTIRKLQDKALGYARFSAYDLSIEKLKQAAEQIRKARPDYIIGYSVALDSLARVNDNTDLSDLGIKAVFATAENFPYDDSVSRIERLFNCPVGMEYGAIETNVMAHAHPEGGFRTFWRDYFLEATERGPGGGTLLRLTSLYPRCFPLVRYEIGDEVQLHDGDDGIALTRLAAVIGRSNAFVTMPDGQVLHFGTFSQAIKEVTGVLRYQVVQSCDGVRLLIVHAPGPVEQSIATIRSRLSKAHPDLGAMQIDIVEDLLRTKAGKSPLVLHED